jgi:hypothetical protein
VATTKQRGKIQEAIHTAGRVLRNKEGTGRRLMGEDTIGSGSSTGHESPARRLILSVTARMLSGSVWA